MKIALVGAASALFGPATLRDIFLSEVLAQEKLEVDLMDLSEERLVPIRAYAEHLAQQLNRHVTLSEGSNLEAAVSGADFVICAIEVQRFHYWAMDFHVPRQFGFRQPYGENGGIGSLFHALRNFSPMLHIARTMERLAPNAWLLNYTNPEHKLCEAISRLTSIKVVGLCHGINEGRAQICRLLKLEDENLETYACGINHFTFFQTVRDRRSGEDLYPKLRNIEGVGHELAHWQGLGLGRILLRRFGLWPSPASNHYGEYIRWAHDFIIDQTQFYYDPARGHPWETGSSAQFVYELGDSHTHRPWKELAEPELPLETHPLEPSGEFGIPLIEAIGCGSNRLLPAVNIRNQGAIPNLPDDAIVEVPAQASSAGLLPRSMEPLPEALAALIRTQLSIHKILVEAYAEESKDKLLQAILLEPTVDSYARAVACMNQLLKLQKEILPPLK